MKKIEANRRFCPSTYKNAQNNALTSVMAIGYGCLGNLAGLVKPRKNSQTPAFLTLPEAKLNISIENTETNPKPQITNPKQIPIFKIPMPKTTGESRLVF
jgi:hypothetical protein